MPNSWVPRLPGVTRQPPPHPSRQALRPGQRPGLPDPTHDQPLDLSSVDLSRLPEPHQSSASPHPLCFLVPPQSLSLDILAQLFRTASIPARSEPAAPTSRNSTQGRKGRAPKRGPAAHGRGQSPEASAQSACALPAARVRALARRPDSVPIAFFLRPTTPQRSSSHRPRTSRRGSACSRPPARPPACLARSGEGE